jgi:hypothetical protein
MENENMSDESKAPKGPKGDEALHRWLDRRSPHSGQRMIALAILAFAGAVMTHAPFAIAPGAIVFAIATLAFAAEYLFSFWADG